MDSHKVLHDEALTALRKLQDPGEPDIVVEVVHMFFEDSAKCREAAESAFAERDAASLAVAAHRLRGSASLLGLERLQHTAEDLEEIANIGGPTDWAARLFRLQEALSEAHLALREATPLTQ
jgi:HPt (histidine-containing phosphotransfer) domain-containing protein